MTASLQMAQLRGEQAVNTAGEHGQCWNKCEPSQTALKETSEASLGRCWQTQIYRKGIALPPSLAHFNLISLPQALPPLYWN